MKKCKGHLFVWLSKEEWEKWEQENPEELGPVYHLTVDANSEEQAQKEAEKEIIKIQPGYITCICDAYEME